MSTESVMPSSHLILSHPLLLPPSIFPRIRVFSNESALGIRWPKYWSFSFSISPSNEHPGLISFRMDWLDLLRYKYIFYYSKVPKTQKILPDTERNTHVLDADCGHHSLSHFVLSYERFSSVQFSRSVVSDSCDPMNRSMSGLCPSPTLGVHSNLCPSSQ